jgi:hypothetical protein
MASALAISNRIMVIEPASVLLERIRRERSAVARLQTSRRRGSASSPASGVRALS